MKAGEIANSPISKTIWISFDLGADGDYPGLYAWLDSHKAKECGNSIAVLKFTFRYRNKLLDSLKSEIEKAVATDSKTRIYVVYRESTKVKGKFIIGGRKIAPWVGTASSSSSADDSDE